MKRRSEMEKTQIRQGVSAALILFIFFVMLFFRDTAAYALPKESRTVRVAYPIQKGITDLDENGDYSGYTYEYLEELAQYTGWDYEFVRVEGDTDEQLLKLMDMMDQGEVDLMGLMYYSDEMGQMYRYSGHSYGTAETVLQVSVENMDPVEINSQIHQTLKIAIINTGGRMAGELNDYCKMNLIDPVFVECGSTEEQVKALQDGRADVMLNSSMNYVDGVRTIARFSPKPFYFVMPKEGQKELALELNEAMLNIEQTDPYLPMTLMEKYFNSPVIKMQLTGKERHYIEQAGPVRVGVLDSQPPFQNYDEDQGKMDGISMDLLDRIGEKTGLSFEYIRAETYGDLESLIEGGEIELVASMPYHYEMAEERNLSMTRPYVSAQYILVTTARNSGQDVVGQRLALPESSLYADKAQGTVVFFENVWDCLKGISDGKADYTYVDAYTAQYFINLNEYGELRMVPQTFEPRSVCYGVVKPGNRELVGILNKAIITIPVEEIQALVNQNTLVAQPHPVSKGLRYTVFFMLLALTFVLVGFCAYYISTRRSEKQLKAAKAQAEDAYRKAEKASLAKSEFLSRMSHEIRTPMNGISGMTAIAMRNMDDRDRVRECLGKVRLSTDHLLALVNDILDMAKIESGKIEFHKEEFDFREFLDRLVALYSGQADEKKIDFGMKVQGSVSGRLMGDPLRLNQILGNLLSNACKFTPDGGAVRLMVSEQSGDGRTVRVRFEVTDTGCGILPENLERIFDSFEQGDTGVTRTYGGTGLGLSIVKRFTEAMGGQVSVRSEQGVGSAFCVEIPFEAPGETAPSLAGQGSHESQGLTGQGSHESQGLAGQSGDESRGLAGQEERAGTGEPNGDGTDGAYDFEGCRILVAEDNELNREIAMELIGGSGAILEPAEDGVFAVELFEASPVGYYDLILMDIQMPRMDGYEATRRIRAMGREDATVIPIIAMTANAFSEDEERCLAAGMNAHIAKPIDIDDIYKKMSRFLGSGRTKK